MRARWKPRLSTRYLTNGAVAESMPARDLLRMIAEATWQCGDPACNSTPSSTPGTRAPIPAINASNPCSEYMHLDDSACNLASSTSCSSCGGRDLRRPVFAMRRHHDHRADIWSPIELSTSEIRQRACLWSWPRLRHLGALLMSLGPAYDPTPREYAGP